MGKGVLESELRSGSRQRNEAFVMSVGGGEDWISRGVARFLGVSTSAVVRAAHSRDLPEMRKYL
jgi:hypothetical protein